MRILHLVPTLRGGGAERQLVLLARSQARSGLHVSVAYFLEGPYSSALSNSPVKLFKLEGWGNWRASIRAIQEVIDSARPNLVQTWLPAMGILGGAVSWWKGLPWVQTERTGLQARRSLQQRLIRTLVTQTASAIVANSHSGKAYWSRRVTQSIPKLVIPNAIEPSLLDASDERPGSEPSIPTFLGVGRLVPLKNFMMLLAGFRELLRFQDARLWIVGDGPSREELEMWSRSVGLERFVTFWGYIPDPWRLFREATAFVSLSEFEGSPNVVLEAMAVGCPVVLSDIPAHRELCTEMSALFVPETTPSAVAGALLAVLKDPGAAAQRAVAAKRLVQDRDPDVVAAMYTALYKRIVAAFP